MVRRLMCSDNAASRKMSSVARTLHAYANNYDFDMNRNGERWLLKQLSGADFRTIVDVGANRGDWLQHSQSFFKSARFFAVEPVPSNFEVLASRFAGEPRVNCIQIALGDSNGTTIMETGHRRHSHARIVSGPTRSVEQGFIEIKIGVGDEFVASQQIDEIDFLKIDVEGHDCQVLRGFSDTLQRNKINVIQFEYSPVGYHYLMSLEDTFSMLDSFGYVVGRLFPKFVRYGSWNSLGDPLFGVNYIAVRKTRQDLIQLTSN